MQKYVIESSTRTKYRLKALPFGNAFIFVVYKFID